MPAVIYTLPSCVQCDTSKRLMKSMNIEYTEVDLSQNEEAYEMVRALGYTAAPVIISGAQHWSGFRMERIKSLVVNRD